MKKTVVLHLPFSLFVVVKCLLGELNIDALLMMIVYRGAVLYNIRLEDALPG